MKRLIFPTIVVLVAAAGAFLITTPGQVAAQSGTRSGRAMRSQSGGTARRPAARSDQTFEEKLWDYLRGEKYTNWAPVPGKSDGFSEGSSPHGAFLKMYLNRTAAGNPQELPYGSMIIKENFGPDQKKLMAVTVMYRTKGYNPDAGDWYWVKYNVDGTVARMPPEMKSMPIAGKAMGCINCHDGADGGDFAFFNDDM